MNIVSWVARWLSLDNLGLNFALESGQQVTLDLEPALARVMLRRMREAIANGADRIPFILGQLSQPLFLAREEAHKLVSCLADLLRLGIIASPPNGFASDGVTLCRESTIGIRSPGARWV